jgi:phosphoribosylformylglycinamidine synthase
MIIFWRGQSALSAFRAERLVTQALMDVQDQPSDDEPLALQMVANTIFALKVSGALDVPTQEKVAALLNATPIEADDPALSAGQSISWIRMPRAGSRSPWSSKATDILHSCGIAQAESVEMGVQFAVNGFAQSSVNESLREDLLAQLRRLTHDRMTQALVASVQDMAQLFGDVSPRPLKTISLSDDGERALAEANGRLGLALSDHELVYLLEAYQALGRDPTDAELMMFAQANSEHCRHKIFNADWEIDGKPQALSLFDMIRNTHKQRSAGVLSAYSDNAAVLAGATVPRFFPNPDTHVYGYKEEPVHTLFKVETHNHPTGIAPDPGAATGAGGEIRDEGATGRGAKPKAGLVGFTVSNLMIPGAVQPWEQSPGRPGRMASPLEIMLEGPIGAASFNNEFGRPNLLGYFRTYEMPSPLNDGTYRGYHKPIMLAGGIGNIREDHIEKRPLKPGAHLVVLGGPALLIGLGGGAASSVQSGRLDAELDFASVQRANPEMERRAQEVIDACWASGDRNPIAFIHDVGAGGLSNALPELVKDAGCGGRFSLNKIPTDDPALSPMELWCNEAQERYVLGVEPEDYARFEALCARERCPYATVGYAVEDKIVHLEDDRGQDPINLPQSVLFGKPPKMTRRFERQSLSLPALDLDGLNIGTVLERILRLPTVASKSFLITIGDRSITGMVARDQMVGPWQVPVADCAVTTRSLGTLKGEAMAMGERSPLAIIDAEASARMAVGEALTNLLSAPVAALTDVNLSANWMAACGEQIEDQALFDAVKAVGMSLCPELGLTIPVGKDSLSMRTQWQNEAGETQLVVSPMSLVISAVAPVDDVRQTLTPELRHDGSRLYLCEFAQGRARLGGSALAQVISQVGNIAPDFEDVAGFKRFVELLSDARAQGLVSAYHDRSDGGVIVSVLEMAFAGRRAVQLSVPETADALAWLFNEELGVVLEVPGAVREAFEQVVKAKGLFEQVRQVATVGIQSGEAIFEVKQGDKTLFAEPVLALHGIWNEVSYRMQCLRDNPDCADQAFETVKDPQDTGLFAKLSFSPRAPQVHQGQRPRMAVLREQGVNGQLEMAAAFAEAGFESVDVHMSDLQRDPNMLASFQGLVACGGFSFGDVLGAGSGWAKSILFNNALRDAFAQFFERSDTLALGVCNGCQMLAQLKSIIPGAEHWPIFERNLSEQFEARLLMAEVMPSQSLWFSGMTGSQLPIAVAHGEGRLVAPVSSINTLAEQSQLCLRFVDPSGQAAERYPYNPNGSPGGLTSVCNTSGRVTIMMPHPERVYRTVQLSWAPEGWTDYSPWFEIFQNARQQFS